MLFQKVQIVCVFIFIQAKIKIYILILVIGRFVNLDDINLYPVVFGINVKKSLKLLLNTLIFDFGRIRLSRSGKLKRPWFAYVGRFIES